MQQPEEKYHVLIAKELAKEINPIEQAELMKWLNQHPDNQLLYNQYKDLLSRVTGSQENFSPDPDVAWLKMKQKISQEQAAPLQEKTKVISLFGPFMKIAASVLIFGGIAAMGFLYMTKTETVELSAFTERTLYVLPDNSKVWLNPNSTITYSSEFNEEERQVNFNGEGYFEITRNENKPFIVMGKNTKVKVLGTSFVVHSDRKDNKEFILVSTGKVQYSQISNEKNVLTLLAGEEAFYTPGKALEKQVKTISNATAWKDNKLTFNNTPLKEVIADLQLYFNSEIVISNPGLLACRFTGSFEAPDLEAVLIVLSLSVNSTFHKKGNQYMLQGAGCN